TKGIVKLSHVSTFKFICSRGSYSQAALVKRERTAADTIYLAMMKIDHEFKQRNFKSKMILQVHNELVFYATKDDVDVIKSVIIGCMQSVLQLPNNVPANAKIGSGVKWLEAHYDQ
ncbi:MAG: hypothetical protein LH478_13735, partial [Chitinophagaceae bacterium]|nr:hypothetical protein [Chitinophagaceae bacterium]